MLKIRALLVVLTLAVAARAGAQVISIAEARSLPAGTVVTVEGSITVPSGDFATSTFDQGFVIEDETGGIYVSTSDNLNLNFHRRVRVTGAVGDAGQPIVLFHVALPPHVQTVAAQRATAPAARV